MTIAESVSETTPENIDYNKVKRCLIVAGLWNKIEQLTNGVNSQFGKTIYDDGVEFSGGEIQKLLLARAMYKNAPVMLLDYSAVDLLWNFNGSLGNETHFKRK